MRQLPMRCTLCKTAQTRTGRSGTLVQRQRICLRREHMLLIIGVLLTIRAILISFIAGTAVPSVNGLTPRTPGRAALGYAAFAILSLILMPLPHALWSATGLHCPSP